MTPPTSPTAPAATLFLSVQDVAQIITRTGIAATLRGLAACIEADYRRWHDFDKRPRVACHSPQGVIELMPIADAQRYAFKYVNGHPGNTAQGLPTVMALGLLADVATGLPLLLADLTLATALRTAAASAVAARALARPDSRCMALIGNGAQSEFQALAFHTLLGISELRLYDTDPAATRKLLRHLQPWPLRLTVCDSVAQAVRGADIVTTATAAKTQAAILTPELLRPGLHLNAIGGDCPGKTELHPDVLRACAVFVQYAPQTRIEGDVQQLPADFPVTELWQVLTGQAPGRRDEEQITLFDSVGFALEDYSALRYLHDRARELQRGQPIGLIPALADPKDLYGLVSPYAPSAPSAPSAPTPPTSAAP